MSASEQAATVKRTTSIIGHAHLVLLTTTKKAHSAKLWAFFLEVKVLLVNAGVWVDVTDLLHWQRERSLITKWARSAREARNHFRDRVTIGTWNVLWPARIDVALLLDFCHASIVSNLGRKSHF